MGIFTNFMISGFNAKQEKFYSPGTLYEVMSKLGEELKPDEMRKKVKTLLGGWFAPADSFREQGQKVPAYALEMHAVNEKNSPRNGYGTYIFVPDEMKKRVVNPVTSIFSKPSELYDDEDPLKILSAIYADHLGFSTNDQITIYELSCREEEFYPLNAWSNEYANDPMEEIFGVFDALKSGEFAGISLVVVPPEEGWEQRGKMRIRYIEDPEYEEEIGILETFSRLFHGEDLPDEEAERLAGYKKQQLDSNEREEIKAIMSKINNSTFRCSLRIYASCQEIADDLAGIIMQKAHGKWNSLEIVNSKGNLLDLAMRREQSAAFLLDADEITSIWHVPAENTMGEKRHKPLPAALTPPEELLAIKVGEPGDIQKLLYSIKS